MFEHVLRQQAVDGLRLEQILPVGGLGDIEDVPVRAEPTVLARAPRPKNDAKRVDPAHRPAKTPYLNMAAPPASKFPQTDGSCQALQYTHRISFPSNRGERIVENAGAFEKSCVPFW